MKRLFIGLVAFLLAFVPVATVAAAAPAPATQPSSTVLFLSVGSTSVRVVDVSSSPVSDNNITLDAAPVSKNGEVYLTSIAMEQVISLYGGTGYALGDEVLSFTVDRVTTTAVMGSTWGIQVTNNMVVPTALFYEPYTENSQAYWPVSLLFNFRFGGVAINETSVDQRNNQFLIYPYLLPASGKG